VEAGAGADLRQYGGAETGVGRAAQRVAHGGSAARSGHSQRRGQLRGGSGGELGERAGRAPPLKAVSFTGSCEIGNWLHGEASKRRLRIQLEMGGKNPTIVLADADFNSAVENVVNAAFFSTGQKVHRHQPRHRGRRHLRPLCGRGGGAHPETEGRRRHAGRHRDRPVRGPGQMETVLRYIEIGRKESGEPCAAGAG
jgi:hypothetical protein